VDFLGKRGGVGKRAVVIGLGFQLAAAQYLSYASTAKATDVREKIEVVERDLKRLHAAHRQTGHCTIVSIGKRTERLIDERNQCLSDVVLERLRHVLHGLHRFG
jgi:hypothetical protein